MIYGRKRKYYGRKVTFSVSCFQLNLTSTFNLNILSRLRITSTDKGTDFVPKFYKQKLINKKIYYHLLYGNKISVKGLFYTPLETTGVVTEWDLFPFYFKPFIQFYGILQECALLFAYRSLSLSLSCWVVMLAVLCHASLHEYFTRGPTCVRL